MPEPFRQSALVLDLSPRVAQTVAVAGSPAAAAETIVAQTPPLNPAITFALGVILFAELAYTIGATATACTVRIRQTGLAGTVIYNTGAMTGGHNTPAQLVSDSAGAFDTAPAAGQIYVVTLQITGGSGVSAVSAASLVAIGI